MATEWALKKAAQAWCTKRTGHIDMQPELAEVFAEMLDELSNEVGSTREVLADTYKELSSKEHHTSDCGTSVAPALMPWKCDCDV